LSRKALEAQIFLLLFFYYPVEYINNLLFGYRQKGKTDSMLHYRLLQRDELNLFWTIERREIIERIYRFQNGQLVHFCDVKGWPPNEAEIYGPINAECFDRGGLFFACFDEDKLAGVSALDTIWRGSQGDLLQLEMMHVSYPYRGRGIGRTLFRQAAEAAFQKGAKGLYISATPSEHTIAFYQGFGSVPIDEPDPELFAREPEDIHLVCPLPLQS
jgi:predicted N-acetyltransferase YhbS